jgi:hypothetical protein
MNKTALSSKPSQAGDNRMIIPQAPNKNETHQDKGRKTLSLWNST